MGSQADEQFNAHHVRFPLSRCVAVGGSCLPAPLIDVRGLDVRFAGHHAMRALDLNAALHPRLSHARRAKPVL